jgi:hypothetical protein
MLYIVFTKNWTCDQRSAGTLVRESSTRRGRPSAAEAAKTVAPHIASLGSKNTPLFTLDVTTRRAFKLKKARRLKENSTVYYTSAQLTTATFLANTSMTVQAIADGSESEVK